MPIKNIIRGQHVLHDKLNRSRELRRDMTPAETILWHELRGNKYRLITSIHFNRRRVYVRHILTHAEYDRGDWKNDTRK